MKANPIANEESLRVQREKKKNIGSESEKAELFFIFSRPLASVLCLIVPSFCFWGTTMEIKLMICFSCVILTINFQWLKILLVTLLFFIVEYIFLKQFVKLLMVKYTYLLCYLLTYSYCYCRKSCDRTKRWLCFIASPHMIKEHPETLPKSPRKRKEVISALTNKFKLRIKPTQSKVGRPKSELTKSEKEWLKNVLTNPILHMSPR